MHAVVTGAAGMLGTALLARHWPGVTWTGVDIRPLASRVQGRATFIRADVRDVEAMTRAFRSADVVIHSAAALPSHRSADIRSVDVDGTVSALEAARRAGVDRFVHISSTAVYGLPRDCPTPEDYPCEPVDPYSAAKLGAETAVLRQREQGLCAPIVRPKTFLGEERLGLFAMLFEWADEGRHFPLIGGGDVATQMLDVEDLCAAIQLICEAPDDKANDTFNIGAREFRTLREDFQAVLDAAGHGKRVLAMPVGPAVAVLRVLAATRLSPVYKRLVHKLTRDSYVSIDRATQQLGFNPRFSNEQALLKTYDWWRANAAGARRSAGRTHRDPWKQGALSLAKALF
ncbi:NAD-dependent epimerase/dehydratase family protein [Micromonospora sp. NPDC051196]|uniref:NAD-dependent epimerase/dehydratase family protein n=1 Tax=Micromonospora sp. NPDC051196 TaxID=3155281 RepID=UPI0034143097